MLGLVVDDEWDCGVFWCVFLFFLVLIEMMGFLEFFCCVDDWDCGWWICMLVYICLIMYGRWDEGIYVVVLYVFRS